MINCIAIKCTPLICRVILNNVACAKTKYPATYALQEDYLNKGRQIDRQVDRYIDTLTYYMIQISTIYYSLLLFNCLITRNAIQSMAHATFFDMT